MNEFKELFDVVAKLRDPNGGCPWDLEQTHESLLKYLIEESYEFIEATKLKSPEMMREELGDVLLQVLLHSVIAEQNKTFTITDVLTILKEKLVRRHPHVFGDQEVKNVGEVLANWETIKKKEKEAEGNAHVKSLIPKKVLYNPALTSAFKIGVETHKIKFDWDHYSQVMYKVEEEWQELKEELPPGSGKEINKARAKEELGDLLFSVAQLARHLEIDPEEALIDANHKFIHRFVTMEAIMKERGAEISTLKQSEMDVYWDLAKKKLQSLI